MGGKIRTITFNGRYKYPFELICLFTFALKSSCAHILVHSNFQPKLKSLSSIKSLSDELFLISVSFLLSPTRIFSLLNLSFFHSSPFFCHPLGLFGGFYRWVN